MRKTVTVRRNSDGTLTIRVGRAVEHLSTDEKTRGQIFDAVKYAAISKGVYLEDIDIVEMLNKL